LWHAHPAELPGREAHGLEERSRLAHEYLGDAAPLVENSDDREGGPPLGARERASIAVREDPVPPFEKRSPALPNLAVRADVLLEDPEGFGDHSEAAARGDRRDAVRTPAQIHSRGAGLRETFRRIA